MTFETRSASTNAERMRIHTNGNVGIGTTAPGTLLDVSGAVTSRPYGTATGETGQLIMRELAAGGTDTVAIRAPDAIGTSYSLTLPGTAGSASQVLTTNGSGVLSWTTPSGGGGALSSVTAATAVNTIANANFAQAWNWDTLSTQTAMSMGTTSGTTGTLLNLTNSFNNATSTGNVLKVSATGASNAAVPLMVTNAGTGYSLRVNDDGTDTDTTPFIVNDYGHVGVGTTAPDDTFSVVGSTNGSGAGHITVRNLDNGNNAYGGVIAYSDHPTWSHTLMGFTSTGWAGGGAGYTSIPASSGFVAVPISNLTLGAGGYINFASGGLDSSLERMRITSAGNVGIGTTVPGTILDAAGAITSRPSGTGTGQTGQLIMRELAAGGTDTVAIRAPDAIGTSYSLTLPGTAGSANQVLTTNGSGVLSWTTPSGGGGALSSVTAATAVNTIANANFAQAWNWDTLTTQTAMSMGTTSGTTGTLLNLTNSFNNATSTGNVLKVTTTGASNAAVPLMVTNAGTGNSLRVNDDGTDTDTTPFVIDASGNVGIGSASPTTNLDVVGGMAVSGQISLGASGGVGTPTLAFDNNTGIYSPSDEILVLVANGGRTFELTEAGGGQALFGGVSVGIGTTAPGTILDAAGAITSRPNGTGTGQTGQLIMRELAAGGTETATIRAPDAITTSYSLTLPATAGTANQVLTTDGAGILSWTTPSGGGGGALSSVTAATAVNTIANANFAQAWNWDTLSTQTAMSMGTTSGTTGTLLNLTNSFNNATSTGNVLKVATTGASNAAVPLMVTNAGTGFSIRVNDDGTDTDTSPFVVTAAGNVGVGTTTPTTALQVNGTATASGFEAPAEFSIRIAGGGNGLVFWNTWSQFLYDLDSNTTRGARLRATTGTAAGPTYGFSGAAGLGMYTPAADTLRFSTASTDRMTIDSSGNVGIGTTAPTGNLHISSSLTGGTDLRFQNTDTGGRIYSLTSTGTTNTGGAGHFYISDTTASQIRFAVTSGGNIGIGTSAPGTILDAAGAITSRPSGTGTGQTGQLIMRELAAGGTDTVAIRAPDAIGTSYSLTLPATAGTANQVLTTDGAGILSWTTPSGGGGALSSVTAATAVNTIANANFAQAWNWDTLTTQTAMSMGTTSGTTGTLLNLTNSFNNATSTGNVLKVSATGASNAAVPLMVTNAGTGNAFRVNDDGTDTDTSPFVIDASGNVAIGTTSAAVPLHVRSSIGGSPIVMTLQSPSNGDGWGPRLLFVNGQPDDLAEIQATRGSNGGSSRLHFITKSTEKMRIDTNGFLGIGATDPGTILDAAGAITSRPFGTGTGQTGQLIMRELAATGTNTFTLRAPDNLTADRVLTLPDSNGSSGQVLSTNGSGVLSWIAPGTPAADSLNFTELADALVLDASTDISATGTNVLSITNAGTGNSFLVNDVASDTSPFVIDQSGKVGIGTTTVAAEFHVSRATHVTNSPVAIFETTDAINGPEVQIWMRTPNSTNTGGDRNYALTTNRSANGLFEIRSSLSSSTDPLTTRFTITGSGSVGIGTTGPGTLLDVAGAITSRPSGTLTGQTGQIMMRELAATGTNTFTLRAPDDLTADRVLTFPDSNGSSGQVLSTNGSGVLSWIAPGAPAADSLNFTELADALVLDANTDIAVGAFTLAVTNDGAGDSFRVNDNGAADTSPFVITSNGSVGIGTTAPSNNLHVRSADAVTNTTTNVLRLEHESSATPAANFGTGILFSGESSTTSNQDMAQISSQWTTATHASRSSALVFSTMQNGGALAERARLDDYGNFGVGATSIGVGNLSEQVWVRSGSGVGAFLAGSSAFMSGINNKALFGQNMAYSSWGSLKSVDLGATRWSGMEADSGALNFYTTTTAATSWGNISPTPSMAITTAGNVGIGTTTPGTILDAAGSITSRPSGTGTGQTGQLIMRELAAGGTETATIRAPDAIGTSYALTLPGTAGASGQILSTDGTGILSWITAAATVADDSLNFDKFSDTLLLDASTDISATGTNVLSITNSGTGASFRVNDAAGDTSPFIINASGDVAIGTTAPVEKLTVVTSSAADEGVLILQNTNAAAYSETSFLDSSGAWRTTFGYGNASVAATHFQGRAFQWLNTGVDFVMGNNSGGLFTVQNAGNVGIGTTAPGTRLDAAGAITSRPFGTGTGQTGQLIMRELAAGGSETATIRAPDALGASYALTLPIDDGTSGQVLSTDGNGILSWIAAGSTISADSLNFTDFADALVLDASTDISVGANILSITNDGVGNSFVVNDNGAADTSPFVIDATGQVGIGTTVPTVGLDVRSTTGIILRPGTPSGGVGGSVVINSATNPAGNVLYINSLAGAGSSDGVVVNSTSPTNPIFGLNLDGTRRYSIGVDVGDSNKFKIKSGNFTGGPSLFTIETTGNVGIGTTTPGTLLDVAGAITSRPFGTGTGQTGQLIMRELAANGTNTATIRVPDTLAADYVLTLPVDDGTPSQVLQTNGSGVLTWATVPTSGGTFLAGDGTNGAPTFSFTNDPDTGFYSGGDGVLEVTHNGITAAVLDNTSWDIYRKIRVVNGGVAEPDYAFFNDPDTGMHNPAVNTVGFSTFGAERMRIDASGNVGIGTTASGTLLDVAGAITSRPSGTGTGQTGQLIMRELAAGGTETATIRAPDAITTSYALTLPTTAGSSGQVLQTNGSGILSWVTAGIGDFLANGTVPMTGNLRLNNNWLSNDGGSEGIRITNTGEVGIGTDTPETGLHYVGSVNLTDFAWGDAIFRARGSNATTGNAIFSGHAGNGASLKTGYMLIGLSDMRVGSGSNNGSMPLHLQTNGTTRMSIDVAGNVGIGTTAPVESLHIHKGVTGYPTVRLTNAATGSTVNDGFAIGIEQNAPEASIWQKENALLNFGTNNTERMRILGNGNIGIGTTTPNRALQISRSDTDVALSVQNQSSTSIIHPRVEVTNYNGGFAGFPIFRGITYRGNSGAPNVAQSGDVLTAIQGSGGSDTAWNSNIAAEIRMAATQTFSSTAAGSSMAFRTTPDNSTTLTTRMLINQDGNVGIGTTTPGTLLEITAPGTDGVVELLTLHNPFPTPSWAGTSIRFEGNGGQKMGSITSQYDSASNNANLIFNTRNGDVDSTSLYIKYNGTLYTGGGDVFGFNFDSRLNAMGSTTAGNTVINGLTLNHSDEDSAGASGIGTRLNFSAETTAADTFAQSSAIESVLDDATNTSKDGSMRFLTLGPNAGAGSNAATEKMRITSAGDVGIGTTVPAHKIHVIGTAGLSTGTAWTNTSDRRLKDIRGKYGYGLDEILKLNTVRFNYKKDNPLGLPSDKEIIGFVAQEVQEVIPEAVHAREDGYLELNVDPIHWASINAIQELHGMCVIEQKQRTQIEARLKAQEQVSVRHGRDIANLKKENEQMRLRAEKAEKENAEIKRRLERIEKLLLNK
jgi:hypothetical protein